MPTIFIFDFGENLVVPVCYGQELLLVSTMCDSGNWTHICLMQSKLPTCTIALAQLSQFSLKMKSLFSPIYFKANLIYCQFPNFLRNQHVKLSDPKLCCIIFGSLDKSAF